MSAEPSVLIVQLASNSNEAIESKFAEAAWTVYSVQSETEAFDKAKLHMPNLIILNTGEDPSLGDSLGTKIKSDALTCSIPIIAFSRSEESAADTQYQWASSIISPTLSMPIVMAKIHYLLSKSRGPKPYVLVVDDEPDLVDITVAELNRAGFIASGASNGAEALDVVRNVQPDAILLDLDMPLLNGWEFLNQVRKEMSHFQFPIVILTGADRKLEDRQEAFNLGVYEYLLKPCDPTEVIDTVRNALKEQKNSQ